MNNPADISRADWIRVFAWVALLSSVLISTLALRYLGRIELQTPHARIYLALAWSSYFALPGILLAVALALVALLLPFRWIVLPLTSIALALLLAVFLVDTEVYIRFRFHVNGFLWQLLTGPGTTENLPLSQATRTSLLAAGTGILCVSVATVIVACRLAVSRRLAWLPGAWFTAWCLSLIAAQGMHLWYEAHYDREVTGITHHFPAYRPLTAKRWLISHGWLDADDARARSMDMPDIGNNDLAYPIHPLDCRPVARLPDVVIIIIDSLRADQFDALTMPHLYALTEHPAAQHFVNHVSGGNSTLGGIFSLFMGIPATYWDAVTAARRGSAWIDAHLAAGYRVGVFSSATLVSPAFDRNVFAAIPHLRLQSHGDTPYERDLDALSDFQDFITDGEARDPRVGILFVDAAHGPSVPPGEAHFQPQWDSVDHLDLDEDFDPLPYRNRYRNALYWLDQRIHDVLTALDPTGNFEDTLLILTADHGEEFNDLGQNFWGHGSNYAQYQTRVPLLMLWPDRQRRTARYRTSHYDIAPTVMTEILGCGNAMSDYSIGMSLFDATTPRDWIPVVGYDGYGIVLEKRIVEIWQNGHFDVLDAEHLPVADEAIDPATATRLIETMSRYYRH